MKYSNFNESNIPTYEECVDICSSIGSSFYEIKTEIDGFPISLFNYRLSSFDDFKNQKMKELRGLSFIFNNDGTLYKRFILLEKFFNLNQVPDTLYSVVKNYKIKFISNKEDGSIASFIQLPNGKILGRSKMGFDNDQANGINKIYKSNKCVKSFVDWCISNDIVAIFEYVGPQNRIVLKYLEEELILLRLRDNKTGKHIDIRDHLDKIGSIKIAPFEDEYTLYDLIEKSKIETEKEGWIVQFDNDHMVKIKTNWYRDLHSIYTNDLYHEDKLIKLIIDEKVDDILGELKEDDLLRKKVNDIISIIKKSISEKIYRILKLYDKYKSLDSIKEFAIIYYNDVDFSDTIKYIKNNISLEDLAKDWILKKTNKLEKAREFIQNNKMN
jgi:T4 RnlA family RNA ligase